MESEASKLKVAALEAEKKQLTESISKLKLNHENNWSTLQSQNKLVYYLVWFLSGQRVYHFQSFSARLGSLLRLSPHGFILRVTFMPPGFLPLSLGISNYKFFQSVVITGHLSFSKHWFLCTALYALRFANFSTVSEFHN